MKGGKLGLAQEEIRTDARANIRSINREGSIKMSKEVTELREQIRHVEKKDKISKILSLTEVEKK